MSLADDSSNLVLYEQGWLLLGLSMGTLDILQPFAKLMLGG